LASGIGAEVLGVGTEMLVAGKKVRIHAFPTVDSVKAYLMTRLHPGDHVLLKGSRGIHLESLIPPDSQTPSLQTRATMT
jgi:UDP-N-acetylmuramyl pentapeptide synthase